MGKRKGRDHWEVCRAPSDSRVVAEQRGKREVTRIREGRGNDHDGGGYQRGTPGRDGWLGKASREGEGLLVSSRGSRVGYRARLAGGRRLVSARERPAKKSKRLSPGPEKGNTSSPYHMWSLLT